MAWIVSNARAGIDRGRHDCGGTPGLLGRDGFDGAFVIDPCKWIHTIGMRFPIDVAYVSVDGAVIKLARVARFRLPMPVMNAKYVIEARAGAFERWGLHLGDPIEIRVSGQLILVATPLGNLGDITARALDVLKGADIIACEDTRRTAGLLTHFGIDRPRLMVVNDHTEPGQIGPILDALASEKTIALVSDAGSPGISDPGERLVAAVLAAGYPVSATPGPSAAIMAISISGLPTGRWVFEGFLPRSGGGRTSRLAEIANEQRTIVLYEAPHRLAQTLQQLADVCGHDRQLVIARELTKLHEEVWRGSLGGAVARAATVEPRGEYVLVLGGADAAGPSTDADVVEALTSRIAGGLDKKTAIAEVASELRVPKRHVYSLALALR